MIDGETGLAAPPSDPDGLAAVLSRLIDDAGLRRRIGYAAEAHVRRHFSIARVADDVLCVYGTANMDLYPEHRADGPFNARPGDRPVDDDSSPIPRIRDGGTRRPRRAPAPECASSGSRTDISRIRRQAKQRGAASPRRSRSHAKAPRATRRGIRGRMGAMSPGGAAGGGGQRYCRRLRLPPLARARRGRLHRRRLAEESARSSRLTRMSSWHTVAATPG